MDVTREIAAVQRLFDEAEKLDRTAEDSAQKADGKRWGAAERLAKLNVAGVTMPDLAKAWGKSTGHVGFVIKAWRFYGTVEIRPRFWDAMELVKASPERRKELEESEHRPGTQARYDRKSTVFTPTVEAIQRTIQSDPKIAERIVADDSTRIAINEAKQRHDRNRESRSKERERERAPGLVNASHLASAANDINAARQRIRNALSSLRDVRPFGPKQRAQIEDDVALLETAVTWLRSFVDSGDIDQELENLLAAE